MVDPTLANVPIEEYLAARIRRAEQALSAHHESVLREFGLTLTQYQVLLALWRRGGMSGAQLARACGVTQQTMTGVLGGLAAKRLIARTESPVHAKVQIAGLTEEGSLLVERAHSEVSVLERSLSQAFSYDEYRAICDLLERATSLLVEQTRPPRPRRAPSQALPGPPEPSAPPEP